MPDDAVERVKDEKKKVEIAVNLNAGNIGVRFKTISHMDETEESLDSLLDLLAAGSTKVFSKAAELAMKIPKGVETVVPASVAYEEDPMTRLATKLDVPKDELKRIIGVVDDSPQIVCGTSKFASREVAALLLLYAFQFGLSKQPSHKELSDVYGKSGFEPSFGTYVKGSLKRDGKISVSKSGAITINAKGVRDVEQEVKRILGTL